MSLKFLESKKLDILKGTLDLSREYMYEEG